MKLNRALVGAAVAAVALVSVVFVSVLYFGAETPPMTRSAQCARFVEAISPGRGAGANDAGDGEPNALLKTANAVEKAGAEATAVVLEDPELVALRDRYVLMARDLGFTTRDAALAFNGDDDEAKARARDRLSTSRAVARRVDEEVAKACPRSP